MWGIHSSSKKKKQPKSSFSIVFRSDVRHFQDAAAAGNKRKKRSQKHHFLWVSEVRGMMFPCREMFYSWCFSIRGPAAAAAKASAAEKGKGSQNSQPVKTRERRGSSFSQLGLEPNHTGLTAQSLFFLEESCRVKRSDTQTFSNFSNYFKRVLKLQKRSSSFSK